MQNNRRTKTHSQNIDRGCKGQFGTLQEEMPCELSLSPAKLAVNQVKKEVPSIAEVSHRERRRVIQKRYYERKKSRIQELTDQVKSQKQKIVRLRKQQERQIHVGYILFHSLRQRLYLMSKIAAHEKRANIPSKKVPSVQNTQLFWNHLEIFVLAIEGAKQRLLNMEIPDLNAFHQEVLIPFWKLGSETGDGSLLFMKVLALGTQYNQGKSPLEHQANRIDAYKSLICSMSKEVVPSKVTTKALTSRNEVIKDFEKLVNRVKFVTNSCDACWSKEAVRRLLPAFSEASWKLHEHCVTMYRCLQQLFSQHQYMHLWIQSPTRAAPDAFEILSWLFETCNAVKC